MILCKGHNSTKRDNPDLKKIRVSYFLMSPSMKFQNRILTKPYLKLVTEGLTGARTDKPKEICPFNFFKVGGITIYAKLFGFIIMSFIFFPKSISMTFFFFSVLFLYNFVLLF